MATIHYLDWDSEQDNHGPASELFHKLTVESVLDEDEKPGNQYTETEFDELYREITEVDVDSPDYLEDIWRQWNRGSSYETQEFYDAEERSMSVGDVIEIDGEFYQAKSIGFSEITVAGEGGRE